MSKIHTLKTWPECYDAMKDGTKSFEYRKNDRDYEVGDALILMRYDPDDADPETGMCKYVMEHGALTFVVTYIIKGDGTFGIPGGYCIMQLKRSGEPSQSEGESDGERETL